MLRIFHICDWGGKAYATVYRDKRHMFWRGWTSEKGPTTDLTCEEALRLIPIIMAYCTYKLHVERVNT